MTKDILRIIFFTTNQRMKWIRAKIVKNKSDMSTRPHRIGEIWLKPQRLYIFMRISENDDSVTQTISMG